MKNILQQIQYRFFPIACFGSVLGVVLYGLTPHNIILALSGWFLYYWIAGSVCYHRLITHRSYTVNHYIEKAMCLLGVFGNLGSPARWSIAHMLHHIHSDTEYDPHPPERTKYFGQFPIITSTQRDLFNIPDIPMNSRKVMVKKYRSVLKDPFHKFLDDNYYYILFGYSLALIVLFGFETFLFFQLMAIVLTNASIAATNYFGHVKKYGAYLNHALEDNSVNNPFLVFLTAGDTLHNNHHRHPGRWNHSEWPWELDPGAWIIRLIKKRDKK